MTCLINSLVKSSFTAPVLYEDFILEDIYGRLGKYVYAYVAKNAVETMYPERLLPIVFRELAVRVVHTRTETVIKERPFVTASSVLAWQRAVANGFENVPLARPVWRSGQIYDLVHPESGFQLRRV